MMLNLEKLMIIYIEQKITKDLKLKKYDNYYMRLYRYYIQCRVFMSKLFIYIFLVKTYTLNNNIAV